MMGKNRHGSPGEPSTAARRGARGWPAGSTVVRRREPGRGERGGSANRRTDAGRRRVALLGVLLVAVPACWLVAVPLAGQADPVRHDIDPERSELYVLVDRAGVLSFLGHEHVITPRAWDGTLCWDPAAPERASARVEVETAALVIDDPADRDAVGLGDGPSGDDLAEIQEKLLDEERLDAEGHPRIELTIQEVVPQEGAQPEGVQQEGVPPDRAELRAVGEIRIRDTVRPVEFPVILESDSEGEVQVEGSFHLRQTDFGIEPESVAGVVRVADEVEVTFSLTAVPSEEVCGE